MIGDGSLTVRARGPRSADSAWERYADLDRWTDWAPQIRGVDTDGRRRLEPGLRGRVRGPAGIGCPVRRRRRERGRADVGMDGAPRSGAVAVHHEIHPQGPGDESGSVTVLRLHGPLPVLVGYAPVARFALHRLVSGSD